MKTKQFLKITVVIKSIIMMLVFVLCLGSTGCKNKKKITENPGQKNEIVKVDENLIKAKSTLQALLGDLNSKSIEEKEKILADIKALNLNDPELNELINKVQASIDKEKEIRAAEEQAKIDALPENILRRAFEGITKARIDAEANALIDQTIQLFTSEKSNVLIIVYKGTDGKDYDEPTNIIKYLKYLKDTKKNLNDVEKIHYDTNGKIKTLELIKK